MKRNFILIMFLCFAIGLFFIYYPKVNDLKNSPIINTVGKDDPLSQKSFQTIDSTNILKSNGLDENNGDRLNLLSGYEYTAKNRRDPFFPLISEKKEIMQSKDKMLLERYETEEFRLSGIIWDENNYIAIVTSPDDKSFGVKEGFILGLKKGKIYKINKDYIVIREYVGNSKNVKDITLKLYKDKEK